MRQLIAQSIAREFATFRKATRANVALIFGLSAVPLLGMVGAAVDFGLASSTKAQLDSALDSAALIATTSAASAVSAGASLDTATSAAQALATTRFSAQVAALSSASVTGVTAVVTGSVGNFSATMNYTADYPTMLTSLLGVGSIPLYGQTSTTMATSPYIDIHVLVDISSSMAIGATQADMAALGVLTDAYLANPPVPIATVPGVVVSELPGCALACHWTNDYPDYYTTAEASGITLRIDVVRNAINNMISKMITLSAQANTVRLALYTFNNTVNNIFPLSSALSNATTATPQVTVGLYNQLPTSPFAESDLPDALYSVTNTMGVAGTGASSDSPRKFLVIITDGVLDYYLGGARYVNAVDPASCAQAKANGVTVMVIYTPYIPVIPPYVQSTNYAYTSLVQPIQSNILSSLQSCASSPALVWQASDTTDFNVAMQQLLGIVAASPGHFTQ